MSKNMAPPTERMAELREVTGRAGPRRATGVPSPGCGSGWPRSRGSQRPTATWRSRRSKPAAGPRTAERPAVPQLSPAARAVLGGLTRRVAGATPDARRNLVAAVRAASPPPTLGVVAGAVVAALLRDRSPATRDGLADALAGFSRAAVPEVMPALLTAKGGWPRDILAGVLARVAAGLPRGERDEVLMVLTGLVGPADRPDGDAVTRAAEAVRATLDPA